LVVLPWLGIWHEVRVGHSRQRDLRGSSLPDRLHPLPKVLASLHLAGIGIVINLDLEAYQRRIHSKNLDGH
jgi:hypothetical protein